MEEAVEAEFWQTVVMKRIREIGWYVDRGLESRKDLSLYFGWVHQSIVEWSNGEQEIHD